MAIVKKGSRRIVVDDIEYRWKIRHRQTYVQGMFGTDKVACAVERVSDKPGSILVIYFPQTHPGNWIGKPAVPLLPSQVAAAIRAALAAGWQPLEPGKPFEYDLRQ